MRKLTALLAAAFLLAAFAHAGGLSVSDVASGKYSAKGAPRVRPVEGSDLYTVLSADGKRIEQWSMKANKRTAVLFDVGDTQGERVEAAEGYEVSPDGSRILIQTATEKIYRRSFKARYYIYNVRDKRLEKLSDGGPQQAPVWSPDGNQVAFVRDNDIYLVKLLYDNAESRVTTDGKPGEVINGVPDWVNEEEFAFSSSLCFNADGTMLCWIKSDESAVRAYTLQLYKGSHPERSGFATYPGEYTYKYPKAGEANSEVSAWSFDIKSRQVRKLEVPLPEEGYMPRIMPTADPSKIIVCTMNRHQDELGVYTVNPRSTVAQLLVREESKPYIKGEVLAGLQLSGGRLLLPSDRNGHMQVFVYGMGGALEQTAGDGRHDVTAVYGRDPQTGDIYYQAAMPTPQDRQVMVKRGKNGKTENLTKRDGWNSAAFAGDFKHFVNTWSDLNTPFVSDVRTSAGKTIGAYSDNKELESKLAYAGLGTRELFAFTTEDGTELYGWMVKPRDFDAGKKHPVVMYQYSGPGSQSAVNSWAAGSMGQGCMFDMYLAQRGFIVVCVDGRGTGARGAGFEKCIYQRLGRAEAADQVAAAKWLAGQPYVDGGRIGIWGWSFGGFCTLMSMSDGSGAFRAGVAVAPPTDFRFYDTVYTELFMRTPKENPDGYADNPITRAPKLKGALLLCHGLADDNVHPQNTFEYAEALVQADKDFRQLLYTNRNHSIYGGNTRNHLLRQIADFFEKELK